MDMPILPFTTRPHTCPYTFLLPFFLPPPFPTNVPPFFGLTASMFLADPCVLSPHPFCCASTHFDFSVFFLCKPTLLQTPTFWIQVLCLVLRPSILKAPYRNILFVFPQVFRRLFALFLFLPSFFSANMRFLFFSNCTFRPFSGGCSLHPRRIILSGYPFNLPRGPSGFSFFTIPWSIIRISNRFISQLLA